MTLRNLAEKALKVVHFIEDALLVGLLFLMICMAVLQIFLRNFWGTGILWGDPLVRILVFWVAMIGAMIASRKGDHIRIDLIIRLIPEKMKAAFNRLAHLTTAAICAALAYYSGLFVLSEFRFGGIAFADIPVWVCEAIMPTAFTVMALRHLCLSILREPPRIQTSPELP